MRFYTVLVAIGQYIAYTWRQRDDGTSVNHSVREFDQHYDTIFSHFSRLVKEMEVKWNDGSKAKERLTSFEFRDEIGILGRFCDYQSSASGWIKGALRTLRLVTPLVSSRGRDRGYGSETTSVHELH